MSWHHDMKWPKKKKIPVFSTHVSFSFLSDMSGYAPICTGLCTSPISCYVFLPGWESLSTMILWDAVHPSTCSNRFLSPTSHEIHCFASSQSSLPISTISSSLWVPSSPLPQISSHPPPNSTQANTFPHKFTSHPTDSTSLPLSLVLIHHIIHSILPYCALLLCYLFFSLSPFFTSSTNFLPPTRQLYHSSIHFENVFTQIHLQLSSHFIVILIPKSHSISPSTTPLRPQHPWRTVISIDNRRKVLPTTSK